MKTPVNIAPAQGKLGVLLVGLGAVSTTTIPGVAAIRKHERRGGAPADQEEVGPQEVRQ